MKKTRPPSIPLIAENGKAENGKRCVSRQKKNKFLCFALDFLYLCSKQMTFGIMKITNCFRNLLSFKQLPPQFG